MSLYNSNRRKQRRNGVSAPSPTPCCSGRVDSSPARRRALARHTFALRASEQQHCERQPIQRRPNYGEKAGLYQSVQESFTQRLKSFYCYSGSFIVVPSFIKIANRKLYCTAWKIPAALNIGAFWKIWLYWVDATIEQADFVASWHCRWYFALIKSRFVKNILVWIIIFFVWFDVYIYK